MTNRSELRQQAQRARSGLAHLNDEANRMQNRIDELEAEVERLRGENRSIGCELQEALDHHDYVCDKHEEENAALRAEVERLREERRWIPVEERLPDEGVWVVCCHTRFRAWWQGICERDGWFNTEGVLVVPTHWQPLPALPMEEE